MKLIANFQMGGCGNCNHRRIAPAAYWASWADVLPTLAQRVPGYGTWFMQRMTDLAILARAKRLMDSDVHVVRR